MKKLLSFLFKPSKHKLKFIWFKLTEFNLRLNTERSKVWSERFTVEGPLSDIEERETRFRLLFKETLLARQYQYFITVMSTDPTTQRIELVLNTRSPHFYPLQMQVSPYDLESIIRAANGRAVADVADLNWLLFNATRTNPITQRT